MLQKKICEHSLGRLVFRIAAFRFAQNVDCSFALAEGIQQSRDREARVRSCGVARGSIQYRFEPRSRFLGERLAYGHLEKEANLATQIEEGGLPRRGFSEVEELKHDRIAGGQLRTLFGKNKFGKF